MMMAQLDFRVLVPAPNSSLDTALTPTPVIGTQMVVLLPVLLLLSCPLSPDETATAVTLL